jgi:hypothetical protein
MTDWDLMIGSFFEGTANLLVYFIRIFIFLIIAKIVTDLERKNCVRKRHFGVFCLLLIPLFCHRANPPSIYFPSL